MTEAPTQPALLETAQRIERHRRHSEARLLILLTLINAALIIAFGLGAVVEVRDLINAQDEQLKQLDLAIEENRQAEMRNAAAQDRILLSIGDRLVPKREVRKLDQNVRRLRVEAKDLRKSVEQLNRLLRRSGAAGGG